MDGAGGMERVRSAAQDDRVASLETQGTGVGGYIGAAFIDHADDAERGADAFDLEPVGAIPGGNDIADRIGQLGYGANAIGDSIDTAVIKFQPVDKRAGHAAFNGSFDIQCIGVENLLPACGNRIGHGVEGCVLLIGGGDGKRSRSSCRTAADIGHQGNDVCFAIGFVEHGAIPGLRSGRFLTQSG